MAIGFLQDEKKQKRRIEHHIQNGMKDLKLTHQDMADYLGLNTRQAFDYQLSHMTFDAYQLSRIFRKLKFDDTEILLLMKGD